MIWLIPIDMCRVTDIMQIEHETHVRAGITEEIVQEFKS